MKKKKLIVISGTIGVGKTTVATTLKNNLDDSVMLDGDWCWMMHPWQFIDENKKMVEDNIVFLINNFLRNPSFNYVIFAWTIRDKTWKKLMGRLADHEFDVHLFSLICDELDLMERMEKGNRDRRSIETAVERLETYVLKDSAILDTTDKNVDEIVNEIINEIS